VKHLLLPARCGAVASATCAAFVEEQVLSRRPCVDSFGHWGQGGGERGRVGAERPPYQYGGAQALVTARQGDQVLPDVVLLRLHDVAHGLMHSEVAPESAAGFHVVASHRKKNRYPLGGRSRSDTGPVSASLASQWLPYDLRR
jgi:hypothetical protein